MKHVNFILIIIITFGFLGVVDSTILLDIHNNNNVGKESQYCKVSSPCDIVDKSNFSEIYGIPISVFGIIFYLLIITVCFFNLFYKRYFHYILLTLAGLGFIASIILFYVMKFQIGAVCPYCLLSEVINIFIAIFAAIYTKKTLSELLRKHVDEIHKA
ncbi:MAG: vitamin K epoxide reductase family protein [Candidatus Woesearchaeota archaeon]|jgi:uncharacterized membrane protein